jgi:hemin uptake protein HemP
MTDPSKPRSRPPQNTQDARETVGGTVVDASALFGSAREIVIVHDGVPYRLRITRRNRLILQK